MKNLRIIFLLLMMTLISLGKAIGSPDSMKKVKTRKFIYDKLTDKFSQNLTYLMNLRSEKYPRAWYLAHKDVQMFKGIDVHKYNAPFGIIKNKNKFKILRHALDGRKSKSLKFYPVLFDRFKEREDNAL